MKKKIMMFVSALAFSASAWAAVDLNTASESDLEAVKGIGPTKAQAIIEYRKKNGGFKSVDDLDNVKGFGKKSVDNLRKEVTVGNSTAAAAGKPDKTIKDASGKDKPKK